MRRFTESLRALHCWRCSPVAWETTSRRSRRRRRRQPATSDRRARTRSPRTKSPGTTRRRASTRSPASRSTTSPTSSSRTARTGSARSTSRRCTASTPTQRSRTLKPRTRAVEHLGTARPGDPRRGRRHDQVVLQEQHAVPGQHPPARRASTTRPPRARRTTTAPAAPTRPTTRVAPGQTVHATPGRFPSAPARPADGSSVIWMYHSHTDEVGDTNSGPDGPDDHLPRAARRAPTARRRTSTASSSPCSR